MNKAKLSVGLLMPLLALSACGTSGVGGGGKKGTTNIRFLDYRGTGGMDWIKSAARRFGEIHKTDSYEEGKTGVSISVTDTKDAPDSTMASDGNDIYLFETNPDIYAMASQKQLLDLSDVVTPLLTKIDADALKRMVGPDGKYYALPHYGWYSNLTYDVDLFQEHGFYFAKPGETDVTTYDRIFGKANFVASESAKKSCGPNGVYGDYDDGLPSSLQELCILFDYMNNQSISPLLLAGKQSIYSFYLTTALWASLSGSAAKDVYCNWSSDPVDIVTGFSQDDLFYKGSGIKKPITESKVLNDENGYLMYDMASRYYALAFLQLCVEQRWFNQRILTDANSEAVGGAQDPFVRESSDSAILYDASYWCHEAEGYGSFEKWQRQNPGRKRNLSMMVLPTQVEGSVSEGSGKKPTLFNLGGSYLYANANVANNPGKAQAVKDFISFLYSDAELAAFTESLGLNVPMTYQYDASKPANPFYANLHAIEKDAVIVNYASDSARFRKNLKTFNISYNSGLNYYTNEKNQSVMNGYVEDMRLNGTSAQHIFSVTTLSQAGWDTMSH